MFNPNEEIQIIGYNLNDSATFKDKYLANIMLTELNKKLELKNRHLETLKENTKLQEKISKIGG